MICGAPALKAHAAIVAGDSAALEALLAEGCDLSEQDPDGETSLHLAVKAAMGDHLGDEPLIEEEGDAPASPSPEAAACLHSLLRNAKSAHKLVAAQHLHNDEGLMPIHVAASREDGPICEVLLLADAPVNAQTLNRDEQHNGQWGKKNEAGKVERLATTDKTALHLVVDRLHEQAEAAEENAEEFIVDSSLVRLLLKHGADANVVDLDMQTPLHVAIMGGLHEVVGQLVEAKADLSLGCKAFGKDNTALHQVAMLRDVRMIKLLVEHGASVDSVGRDGWTPLGLAVRSGAIETAKALLEARADVSAVSGSGRTPLEIAAINSKPGMTELLKAAEAVQLS